MKKNTDIAIIFFAIWSIITGIVDSDIHILISSVFTLLICIHVFLYRKLIVTAFKGSRRLSTLILLTFMLMVITIVVD
jgi:hypothetical protein